MSNMSPVHLPHVPDEDMEQTRRPISFEELQAEAEAQMAAVQQPKAEPVEEIGARKPRVALMGEFSAGKSTLTNLLMGCRPLPERVTATRLSPVWISKGTGGPRRVRLDGQEEAVQVDQIGNVPIEGTRMIRLFLDQPQILEYCDLIDFPGISDPNMDSEVWERLLPDVDMILWCTHATQAWRQSEAAVWDMVPEAVRERSLLMVTRFDKLTTERDRTRVLNRLRHETGDLFGAMFPICLLQALKAGQTDSEAWMESGAGPFSDHLIHTLRNFSDPSEGSEKAPDTGASASADTAAEIQAQPVEEPQSAARRIIPRRIRPMLSGMRRSRPPADDSESSGY